MEPDEAHRGEPYSRQPVDRRLFDDREWPHLSAVEKRIGSEGGRGDRARWALEFHRIGKTIAACEWQGRWPYARKFSNAQRGWALPPAVFGLRPARPLPLRTNWARHGRYRLAEL